MLAVGVRPWQLRGLRAPSPRAVGGTANYMSQARLPQAASLPMILQTRGQLVAAVAGVAQKLNSPGQRGHKTVKRLPTSVADVDQPYVEFRMIGVQSLGVVQGLHSLQELFWRAVSD